MWTGHAISRNTRAVSAGLKMLLPSPPNRCFATNMAMRPPAAIIHQGAVGGRFMPRSMPVTSADMSFSDPFVFSIFMLRNSKVRHDTIEMTIVRTASSPK